MSAVVLRAYQERGYDFTRTSFGSGNRRVMYYSPTGSGKTVFAEAMIRGALEKGGKVLFVANRKQLVAQASAHLTRAGIEHGILQAENSCRLDARVLVCSIDTIAARGIPHDVTLIIIDEAHAVAGSKKYRELLFKYNRVPVVGLSATPFSKGLGKHYDELNGPLFQDLVVGATIRELIDQGSLVDVDCFAPSDPDLTGVKTQRGIGGELDYNERELAEAVDKPHLVGDMVLTYEKHASGKQAVAFCVNRAHSQHFVEQCRSRGHKAEHIDYFFTDEERAAVLGRFASGETMILSNVGLLAEGWDCPSCEVMILGRPTRSLIRFIQMSGRVLRPHLGKERALILDHSGTVLRLGFPTDDLPLELDDGIANTSSSRKQERKASEPKPCPKCKFVRPAGVHECPHCGCKPERQSDVETREGELVKLNRKTKKPASPDRKQHVYSQLLHICRKKGHKPGWTAQQYRKMFGVWPRGMLEVTATPTPEIEAWLTSQRIAFRKAREKQQEGGAHG